MTTFSLGIDLGSSSVKVAILNLQSGEVIGTAQAPAEEMRIEVPHSGWAEQDPEMWWMHTVSAIENAILTSGIDAKEIVTIGIAYQMHGLVAVDEENLPVRPSIIWCDSRAADIGNNAREALGNEYCTSHLLNAPGNFTASKLAWVRENEPDTYQRISKIMLPGDYIAMKLGGEVTTTVSGLSEGIFWDYMEEGISKPLLNQLGVDRTLLADQVPGFGHQGKVTESVSELLGLNKSVSINYRAGDQPNNALSLNALEPGEVAATAGTSGVIYAVTNKPVSDPKGRVNTFIHVNHTTHSPRYGVLLCVNGTGIMNSWLRRLVGVDNYSYDKMNDRAGTVEPGSNGLFVYPYGNGIERVFENRTPGASFSGLDLNRHTKDHMFRATQEGIAFALKYGFEILKEIGVEAEVIRVGNANMFLSDLFCEIFVNSIGVPIEVFDTDGAAGAARGAGLGVGAYQSANETFAGLRIVKKVNPEPQLQKLYRSVYEQWNKGLQENLKDIS